MDSPVILLFNMYLSHCRPMDYWIAGLMDCCKSKSYAEITIWEKSEMPIQKLFLKSIIDGFYPSPTTNFPARHFPFFFSH
jgi:hypothetical protein